MYSLERQLYQDILVNDGSKDNSQDIIDEYKEKYPDMFFPIIQENQGIGMARNNALQKATGEYIMFIDNDDYIDKDYIAKHVEQLKNNWQKYADAVFLSQQDIVCAPSHDNGVSLRCDLFDGL